MSKEAKAEGCVAQAAGPIVPKVSKKAEQANDNSEEKRMNLMVGKEAPDFEAAAFHGGGFKNAKLSDYRGKWVFLCFYPGDFTFV